MAILMKTVDTNKDLGPVYACCGRRIREFPEGCGCEPKSLEGTPMSRATAKLTPERQAEALESIDRKLGALIDRLESAVPAAPAPKKTA